MDVKMTILAEHVWGSTLLGGGAQIRLRQASTEPYEPVMLCQCASCFFQGKIMIV